MFNFCFTSHLLHLQTEGFDGAFSVSDIKLYSNPSAFNVYYNVRHCVLDWQQREASLALASHNSVQSGDSDSEEEEEYHEPPVKLPKVSKKKVDMFTEAFWILLKLSCLPVVVFCTC